MRFCLMACGAIVDEASDPQLLEFDKVREFNQWSVWVWYVKPYQFSEIATVDLSAEDDYHYWAKGAMAEVREELSERFDLGEFAHRENWVDSRAIAIGEEG